MSLYFYHYRTPQGALLADPIGSEHETDEEAVHEAVICAAELTRGGSRIAQGGAFEIQDDTGWLVERVPLWRH